MIYAVFNANGSLMFASQSFGEAQRFATDHPGCTVSNYAEFPI